MREKVINIQRSINVPAGQRGTHSVLPANADANEDCVNVEVQLDERLSYCLEQAFQHLPRCAMYQHVPRSLLLGIVVLLIVKYEETFITMISTEESDLRGRLRSEKQSPRNGIS